MTSQVPASTSSDIRFDQGHPGVGLPQETPAADQQLPNDEATARIATTRDASFSAKRDAALASKRDAYTAYLARATARTAASSNLDALISTIALPCSTSANLALALPPFIEDRGLRIPTMSGSATRDYLAVAHVTVDAARGARDPALATFVANIDGLLAAAPAPTRAPVRAPAAAPTPVRARAPATATAPTRGSAPVPAFVTSIAAVDVTERANSSESGSRDTSRTRDIGSGYSWGSGSGSSWGY